MPAKSGRKNRPEQRPGDSMAGELTLAELAEKYDEKAADCARWAREARVKRKAAFASGDLAEFERWAGIAREWGSCAVQLRQDAADLRAQAGE